MLKWLFLTTECTKSTFVLYACLYLTEEMVLVLHGGE